MHSIIHEVYKGASDYRQGVKLIHAALDNVICAQRARVKRETE